MKSTSIISLFSLSASISASALVPRFTNTTTSNTTDKSLIEVGGVYWKSDGCVENLVGWSSFALILSSAELTIETCLGAAPAGSLYAGLYEDNCYAATSTNNATVQVADGKCSIECGGDVTESCGGFAPAAAAKRDIAPRQDTPSTASLLSLYAVIEIIPPSVYISIVVTNYVSVCPTGLTTLTYTATLTNTHCGCLDYTPVATIPMTTTVGSCGCGVGGAQKTYTVTVPEAVAAAAALATGSTGVYGAGAGGNALFTGGASSVKGAAAALVGAGAFAIAML